MNTDSQSSETIALLDAFLASFRDADPTYTFPNHDTNFSSLPALKNVRIFYSNTNRYDFIADFFKNGIKNFNLDYVSSVLPFNFGVAIEDFFAWMKDFGWNGSNGSNDNNGWNDVGGTIKLPGHFVAIETTFFVLQTMLFFHALLSKRLSLWIAIVIFGFIQESVGYAFETHLHPQFGLQVTEYLPLKEVLWYTIALYPAYVALENLTSFPRRSMNSMMGILGYAAVYSFLLHTNTVIYDFLGPRDDIQFWKFNPRSPMVNFATGTWHKGVFGAICIAWISLGLSFGVANIWLDRSGIQGLANVVLRILFGAISAPLSYIFIWPYFFIHLAQCKNLSVADLQALIPTFPPSADKISKKFSIHTFDFVFNCTKETPHRFLNDEAIYVLYLIVLILMGAYTLHSISLQSASRTKEKVLEKKNAKKSMKNKKTNKSYFAGKFETFGKGVLVFVEGCYLMSLLLVVQFKDKERKLWVPVVIAYSGIVLFLHIGSHFGWLVKQN